MNPYELMKFHENEFTKSDLIVKNSIIDNPEIIIKFNIITASELMNVSKSAILRFCKKLGYNGFSDFKYDLSRYIHAGSISHLNEEDTIKDVLTIMSKAIIELGEFIDVKQLDELAKRICTANNIRIFGIHSTSTSCLQLYYRLLKIGIIATASTSSNAFAEISPLAKTNDLHILFSMSSTTFEYQHEEFFNEDNKAQIVLITQNNKSKLKNLVNQFILLPSLEKNTKDYFIEAQFLNFAFIELLSVQVSKYMENNMSV